MDVELTGRPLIGVTTSEVRLAEKVDQTPEGEPPLREMALGLRNAAAPRRSTSCAAARCTSTSGVIEAIENQRRELALGVQWHAECIAERPEQGALFRGLVGASRDRDAAWPGRRAA